MSLLTRAGRIHVPDLGWTRQVTLLQAGTRLGGAKRWYDRSTQRFFLLVRLAITPPDPTPARKPQLVGIAVGSRSPCYGGHAGQQGSVLFGKGEPQPGGPFCPPAKTPGAARARGRPRACRIALGQADETAQAEYQPHDEQTHPGDPSCGRCSSSTTLKASPSRLRSISKLSRRIPISRSMYCWQASSSQPSRRLCCS